uniref:Uncharacterized protein n=1 Tax=Romanomermis culicivorax TaxID=13658 RepID=A0A915K932_ROMCU
MTHQQSCTVKKVLHREDCGAKVKMMALLSPVHTSEMFVEQTARRAWLTREYLLVEQHPEHKKFGKRFFSTPSMLGEQHMLQVRC